jgi:hypothetical protein
MRASTRLLVAMSILGLAGGVFEGKHPPAQPREVRSHCSTLPLADYEAALTSSATRCTTSSRAICNGRATKGCVTPAIT